MLCYSTRFSLQQLTDHDVLQINNETSLQIIDINWTNLFEDKYMHKLIAHYLLMDFGGFFLVKLTNGKNKLVPLFFYISTELYLCLKIYF